MTPVVRAPTQSPILPSRELLFDLVEKSHDLIHSVRPDGSFHYVNRACRETLGYRSDEIYNLTVFDFVHPIGTSRFNELFRRVLSGETLEHVEVTLAARDGRAIEVEGSIRCCSEQGQPTTVWGVFRNVTERRRLTAELRESEEKLRLFIEHAPVALAIFDRRMRYLACSRRWLLDYRLGDRDIIGRSHYEVFPEIEERWMAAHRRSLAGEIVRMDEDRFVRADGSVRWLRWEVRPWHSANGGVGGIVIFTEDITDSKQSEAALRAERERYLDLFEHTPIATWEEDFTAVGEWFDGLRRQGVVDLRSLLNTDPELVRQTLGLVRVVNVNQTAVTQNAATDKQQLIAGLSEMFSETTYQAFVEELVALWQGQNTIEHEFHCNRLDGMPLDIIVRIHVPEVYGRRDLSRVIVTGTDITLRKQTETFLRMSQQAGQCGSWEWDLSTNRVRWSDEMCRIHGIEPAQFPGTLEAAVAYVHPEDRPHIREGIQVLLVSHQFRDTEYRIVRPNGEERTLWGRGLILFDPAGRAVCVIGTVTDITERKRGEEERRRLEARILHAQKLESLGILAGGIAHDFNNLLTGILGYAGLALMQSTEASPVYTMLQEIENGGRRAAELTQQMLAYSGRGKFVIKIFRLDTLVREMTRLLSTVVSKKAAINLNLDPALVEGDATQIRQIVMNLITNASDALEGQSGGIDIHTGVREADATFLRSPFLPDELPPGAYAYITVGDNGCGMAEETLQRIFDPFFTTKLKGRGFGLAAVLGIVKSHRGVIKVESNVGRGTTFQVLFPCPAATKGEEFAVAPSRTPSCGRGTVLIVDDEPVIRSFVARSLESVGFQVHEAGDGIDGLTVFQQHRKETVAVVLDLTMPRMDGMEFLGELRRLQSDVPVLVISGYSQHEISTRISGKNARAFLQKPFGAQDIIAGVCQVVASGER